MKSADGLSHVMSVLLSEESANSALASALQPTLPPPPAAAQPVRTATPATSNAATVSALATAFSALSAKVKLNRILKNAKKGE